MLLLEARSGLLEPEILPVIGRLARPASHLHPADAARLGHRVVGVYPGPVETDMAAELPMGKTSPEAVAEAILDGLEQGLEEIYPDPFAVALGSTYAVDPKGVERGLGLPAAAA